MKKEQGITLISLIIYIIGMIVVIVLAGTALSFYNNNVVTMNDTSDVNMELNKLETQMITESQTPGNMIAEVQDKRIAFTSGNIYKYQDNRIYKGTVPVCNYVKSFLASLETDGNKQILKIYVVISKGKVEEVKNLTYVLEKTKTGTIGATHVGTISPFAIDENGLAKENTIIKPNKDSNIQIVIPTGFAPAILEGSKWTTSLPGQSGKVIGIMPVEKWSNITEEDINKGIVIVDNAITYTDTVPDFNEFVWVPIPESDDFDRTAWTIGTNAKVQTLAETVTYNAYWEDTTTTEYTNMVSSVHTHKGFYIGRYEASVNGTMAQSKRSQQPQRGISQTASITACTSNTAIPNIHLMYGIEWDSTLNWLNGKATIASYKIGQTKTMELEEIQSNSNTWGNYKYATGNASAGKDSLQKTGYSEYWKANNIYDLAGNVYEWTQEKYSTGDYRAYRGGYHGNNGENYPAALRTGKSAGRTYDHVRIPYQLLFIALPPDVGI